jgi:hypothetical protein
MEAHEQPLRPSPARRLALACAIGTVAALLTHVLLTVAGERVLASDFTYPWIGARAMLHGIDPYRAVFSATVPWGPFMLYPAPAFVIVMPVAWLPVRLAADVFLGLSCGWLAFVVSREALWPLMLFVSAPILQACDSAQWSPMLVAAGLTVPALGLLSAKPTIGLPLMLMQSSRRAWMWAIGGGLVLIAVTFALQPHWLSGWLAAVRGAGSIGQYAIPAKSVIGFPLVLAAMRWRRREARLLLVMALVPQKMMFYDQLPLLLVPKTRREMTVGVGCSLVAYALAIQFPWITDDAAAVTARLFPYIVVGMYLPALVMVLRRPNAAH